MITRTKSRYLKTAVLVVVLSTAVYAAFNFDPSSQPLVTLAPYGLKSYNLATPDNRAYRPWLENGAYQGDSSNTAWICWASHDRRTAGSQSVADAEKPTMGLG